MVVDSDDDGGDAVTVSECVSRVLHRPLENTITLEISAMRAISVTRAAKLEQVALAAARAAGRIHLRPKLRPLNRCALICHCLAIVRLVRHFMRPPRG